MKAKLGRPKLPPEHRRVQLNLKVRPDVKERLIKVVSLLGKKNVSRLVEEIIDNTYWDPTL